MKCNGSAVNASEGLIFEEKKKTGDRRGLQNYGHLMGKKNGKIQGFVKKANKLTHDLL